MSQDETPTTPEQAGKVPEMIGELSEAQATKTGLRWKWFGILIGPVVAIFALFYILNQNEVVLDFLSLKFDESIFFGYNRV